MKKLSILFILLFAFFVFTESAQAKLLPQAKKSGAAATVKSSGIGVSPALRADRRALNVYFSNLQNALSVSYLLTYKTSIQDEGARGTLNLTGSSSATSELLFGTCSKGVCRYHTGIKDAKLEISYTSKSGKKYIKKYKIKV